MDTIYQILIGDGNEGNFPRGYVTLTDADDPVRALRNIVAQRYITGGTMHSAIMKNAIVDWREDGAELILFEGPEGEQAFGAAYVTAELIECDEDDIRAVREALTLSEVIDSI